MHSEYGAAESVPGQAAASAAVPAVSVVAPCFNEEAGLPEFHRRAAAACRQVCGERYEIVLVDDGSQDGTWRVIRGLSALDPRVVGVRLMRNYGHQVAANAGLSLARGERVLLFDADLQDPPELLGRMTQTMDDEEADVVFGQRIARAGETRFKIASASIFYRLLSRLAAVPIPADTGSSRSGQRPAMLHATRRNRFCWAFLVSRGLEVPGAGQVQPGGGLARDRAAGGATAAIHDRR